MCALVARDTRHMEWLEVRRHLSSATDFTHTHNHLARAGHAQVLMRSHPLYYDDTDDSKILQQWHMCHSNRYAYVSHGNGPKAGTPLTIIVAYEFGMGLRPAPDGAGPVVSVRWGWQPF